MTHVRHKEHRSDITPKDGPANRHGWEKNTYGEVNMKHQWRVGFFFLLSIVMVQTGVDRAFAGPEGAQGKPVTLRYLYSTSSAYVAEFAEELGYLEKAGIKLQKVGTSAGTAIEGIQTVSGNNVEFSTAAWLAVASAIASGVKIWPVMNGVGVDSEATGYAFTVLNDSTIKDAKDFEDKRVAMAAFGSRWEYMTKTYLRKVGVSAKEVQMILVPLVQQEQALRTRQVDVISVGDPIKGKILDGGGTRELPASSEYDIYNRTEIGTAPIIFRAGYLKENPEIARKFVEACAKAFEWARSHPKERRLLYAKILKTNGGNPDLARYWYGFGVRKYGLIVDGDVRPWLEVLKTEGKFKNETYEPSRFYSNHYNPFFRKQGSNAKENES